MTLLAIYFAFEISVGAIIGTWLAFGLDRRDWYSTSEQHAAQQRADQRLGARVFLASLLGLLPLVGLVALIRVADVPSMLVRSSPPESGDLSFPEK